MVEAFLVLAPVPTDPDMLADLTGSQEEVGMGQGGKWFGSYSGSPSRQQGAGVERIFFSGLDCNTNEPMALGTGA